MDNQMLGDKRKRVHARLEEYRSLPEYILDGMGAILERILNPAGIRKRSSFMPTHPTSQEAEDFPSYWWNGVLI